MPPTITSPVKPRRDISTIMRCVKGADTTPELIFRSALGRRGIAFECNTSDVLGKPDIVIRPNKLAIFIDGDFWHGGQWRNRRLTALEEQFETTASKSYWLRKIRNNIARDCSVSSHLLSDGWRVMRFWESAIPKNVERYATLVQQIVHQTPPRASSYALAPQRTVAEFFAGIGLMRMGLEKRGWTTVFANDIDMEKYEMYRGHFADAATHYRVSDIHALHAKDVPNISLATASFPCNDLSLAGSRHGLNGKQSSAFWGFVDVLTKMGARRPPFVLLENVTGFLTSHHGADFKDALLALNRLGYSVDALILDAAWFVPQSRQRLFVIGTLQGHKLSQKMALPITETLCRPAALVQFMKAHPEIKWNVRELPPVLPKNSELGNILEDIAEESPLWWSRERAEYLLRQMSKRHRAIADRMIRGAHWSYGTVFRRIRHERSMAELRTDGRAGCLRTPRGGSGRQILFKAGKGKYLARLLTPRECAKLMGADDYNITVGLNPALFGFGDAVCVPVIEWLAEYYLNPLVCELLRGRPLALRSR